MTKICQSCGMPLENDNMLGTEENGLKSQEYCMYCYNDGLFTQDCSMDMMIDHCLKFLDDFNRDSGRNLDREEAKREMEKFFPSLKRWQNDGQGK